MTASVSSFSILQGLAAASTLILISLIDPLSSQWTLSCPQPGPLPTPLELVSGLSECKLMCIHTSVQPADQQGCGHARIDDSHVCPMVERRGYPPEARSRFVIVIKPPTILKLICAEAQVAHLAASYLKWLSIGIPGYGGTVLIKK